MGMAVETSLNTGLSIAELQDWLAQSDGTWSPISVSPDFYNGISNSIRVLSTKAASEPYLLRDWVWINAQFRISHPQKEEVARISWSAICVFNSLVELLEQGNKDVLPNICWLTDKTVETLLGLLGPQAINKFISLEEQSRIDDLLIELAEDNGVSMDDLEVTAKAVAKEFSTIHHNAYFPSIATKLLGLCKVAHKSSESGIWAQAALRYVHLEKDIINDNQGYVGYLDDIHVVENMYSFVFGELPWKRLIDHASEKWPFLTRTYWADKETTNHLPLFLKAAISCCLDSSLERNQSRTIVLPETGPCGFLSAAACVIADIGSKTENATPLPESLVSFRNGHIQRYVMMDGEFELPDGTKLLKIKLRDCERSIALKYAELLEAADISPVTLATSRQFDEWLETINSDSQTAVQKFHSVSTKTSVVYVTGKSDFFHYLDKIRPYGRRLDELVSVEYRSRTNKLSLASRASVATPAMIVCSSLDVAESILRDRDSHCTPGYMVVDRSVDHITLGGLIERAREYCPEMKVVAFSPLDTRTPFYLKDWKDSVWFIQPQDIDPIHAADVPTAVTSKSIGPLGSYVKRQNRAANVEFHTRLVEFPELDDFCEVAQKIMQRARKEQEVSLLALAMNAEAVLRYISTHPPVGKDMRNGRLVSVLNNLTQHAMAMGIYDQDIDTLATSGQKLLDSIKISNPKSDELFDLISEYGNCHVVVASRPIAESLSNIDKINCNHDVKIISIHDLEDADDIEMLVVPGWLGKREMLRLQFGGWSGVQIRLLYKFEYQRTSMQNKRLEKTTSFLGRRMKESWESFSADNPEVGSPQCIDETKESTEIEVESDKPEDELTEQDEWTESVIRKHIASTSLETKNRSEVNGRLMLFSDGHHYGFFAENAKLVCLNEVLGGDLNVASLSEKDTEKLLLKGTKFLEIGDVLAFPDDPALGDVIDGLADVIIGDSGDTRRNSAAWRNALQSIYKRSGWSLDRMREKLNQCGVERTTATLASWLYISKTIAPRNPSETIPRILECAEVEGVSDLANTILKDVDAIYAARRKAGHILVSQLSKASLSALGDIAYVELGGQRIRYKVLSISSIDGTTKFDASTLGLHSIGEGHLEVKP